MKKYVSSPPAILTLTVMILSFLFLVLEIPAALTPKPHHIHREPTSITFVVLMTVLVPVIVALASALYQLPAFIAYNRKHNMAGTLWAINLVFGWTLLGFFVCLIWACTYSNSAERDQVFVGSNPQPQPVPQASLKEQLEELKQLHDEGLLDENEYQARRQRILS